MCKTYDHVHLRLWWSNDETMGKNMVLMVKIFHYSIFLFKHSKCIKHIKSNKCTCIKLLSLKDRQITNNFLFQFPCSQIYPKNYTGSIYIIAFTSSRCTIKYKTYVFKNHFKKSTFNVKPLCDRYNLYIISPVAQCVARRAPMQQCVRWLVRAPSSS